MLTKICNRCKKELPKNKKYFHVKNTKNKLADGTIKIYYSFRHQCIPCANTVNKEYRRKKVAKEKGWDINNYDELMKEVRAENNRKRTINPEAKKVLKPLQYAYYLEILRKNEDIDFHNYEKEIARRKHEHGRWLITTYPPKNRKYFTKEEKAQAKRDYAKKHRDNLGQAYLAHTFLGVSVDKVSKEEFDIVRKIVKTKRKLKDESKKTS